MTHFWSIGCVMYYILCSGCIVLRRIHEITHWFVNCRFEAASLDFDRRHLGFSEPEVTNSSSLAIPDDPESTMRALCY